jgi:hypothetical protein
MIRMLGKLIDGMLITPSEMERKKIVITNPSEESLKFNLGYKDLIIDEQPEYDEMTHYLRAIYEETDTTIIQHWEVKEIPEMIEEMEVIDV